MRKPWRRLRSHLLVACPEPLVDSVERALPIRCLVPPASPRTLFVSRRSRKRWRWEALDLGRAFGAVPWQRTVRRFVVETEEPEAALARRLHVTFPSAYASLDFEVRGQVEVAHGSPTPEVAIRAPEVTPSDVSSQPAFHRLGLIEFENAPDRPRGEGVTVVILDSGPGLGRGGLPRLEPGVVDVYVEWPHKLPEEFPVWAPVVEPESVDCGLAERWRPMPWSPYLATDDQMRTYRAYHGAMVAGLVRRVAPQARIVLISLLNPQLATATYELVHAMRWVHEVVAAGVPAPDTRRPLLTPPVVYNLSLGVARSQPETVQSCALLAVVDELSQQPAVLVCAAGNDSQGRPENCLEPAAYGQYGDTRAVQTQVIPVAATSALHADRYAYFSNEAHFGAPGEDLLLDCGAELFGSRYVRWSGTSFAAGLASGVVAVLLSSGLPPERVKARLWETAIRPARWDGVHAVRL